MASSAHATMATPVTDSTVPTLTSALHPHAMSMQAVLTPMVVSLAHVTRALPVTVSHAPTLTSAPHHHAMPTPAVTILKDSVDSFLFILFVHLYHFLSNLKTFLIIFNYAFVFCYFPLILSLVLFVMLNT